MKLFLKIIGFAMIGFLVIALILYLNGITHVEFDSRYYTFMLSVNKRLSEWADFTIPSIPSVDNIDASDLGGDILNYLIFIVNALIWLVNLVITLLNSLLEVMKFLVAIIICLFQDIPKYFQPNIINNTNSVNFTL